MIDWDMVGTWADIATAGTAFAALIVASIAAVATWNTNSAQQKTLELQRNQFELTQEQLERAQASKVAFYVNPYDLESEQFSDRADDHTAVARRAHVLNASEGPIYLVVVAETTPEPRILFETEYLFPTGPDPVVWPLEPATDCFPPPTVKMYFTDAAGGYWVRGALGALDRAAPGEIAEMWALTMRFRDRDRNNPVDF